MAPKLYDPSDIRYKPIEDYGAIGNLKSIALVGMDGSIDFMCFPHFDSPTVFAALLDYKKGGRFKIAPAQPPARCKQLYFPGTNILLTRFLFEDGVGEITDFMPLSHSAYHEAVVRHVKCVRGKIKFEMQCSPRFDYGRADMQVEKREQSVVFASKGKDKVAFRLLSPVDCEIKSGGAFAQFTLSAGESLTFVLEHAEHGENSPARSDNFASEAFKETTAFWSNWIARSQYNGRFREVIERSALTLKLMTSSTYGSIIAAPTFGLPEVIGGERNWDYRYTWIRDASFTLYALMRLGFMDETTSFMRWIEARCGESNADGSLQIMYGIDGRHDLPESSLEHFEGYRKSSPVRIGNGAAGQLQLDIYGELMDSVYIYNRQGQPISDELWKNLVPTISFVCKNWNRKDEGIWEVRGGQREFLYSRIMCWVAIDRAIRLATERSFPAPLSEWVKVRDAIYQDVFHNFWSTKRKAFSQSKGSDAMDASTLIMPMVKMISPLDPSWLSTLSAIEQDLVSDSLVYRYRLADGVSDGLAGDEGTFSLCSFWYVENLARSGDLEKARFLFDKMGGYANHLGLYSEQIGKRGEHLGNMPQAFTHIALISAAFHLNRLLDEKLERSRPAISR